jgi:hypothetical protein
MVEAHSAAGYIERTMTVEKTIEFILQHQARTEVVLARVTDRQDRAEESMTGIRTILKTGMRMMVKLTAAQKRTEAHLDRLEQKVERLAEAQGHTQKSLDRLIKSLHGPHTNGR